MMDALEWLFLVCILSTIPNLIPNFNSPSTLPRLWWIDPAGGISISLYIIFSWVKVAMKQIDQIVGRSAPNTFIQTIKELSNSHDDDMEADAIRAYHFGNRYIVEIEVVFPPHKTVQESHDIAVVLQKMVSPDYNFHVVAGVCGSSEC